MASRKTPPSMASSSRGGEASESPQDGRYSSFHRCIQSLVHACQCRNASCAEHVCQKMKRVARHTKGCKRKTNGGCPVCKQFMALCCYHAKRCQENACPVPYCLNVRQKMMWRCMAALSPQQQEVPPQQQAPPQGPQAATPMESPPTSQQPPCLPAAATAPLQALLHALQSPSSPQQQQQVLRILRSNPQLMAAFVKQRAAKYQASQQQV